MAGDHKPQHTTRYFYGGSFESTWQIDAGYRTLLEDGTTPFAGKVLAFEAPTRLVYTYHHIAEEETARERPSRVTWEVASRGSVQAQRHSRLVWERATRDF